MAGLGRELTERQRRIAALVAEGRSDQEIAADLGITARSVRGHVEAVLHRLALADRQQLAVWCAQREPAG